MMMMMMMILLPLLPLLLLLLPLVVLCFGLCPVTLSHQAVGFVLARGHRSAHQAGRLFGAAPSGSCGSTQLAARIVMPFIGLGKVLSLRLRRLEWCYSRRVSLSALPTPC